MTVDKAMSFYQKINSNRFLILLLMLWLVAGGAFVFSGDLSYLTWWVVILIFGVPSILVEQLLNILMTYKYKIPFSRSVEVRWIVNGLLHDSILYNQGLRNGDQILSLNGKNINEISDPYRALREWWRRDSLTVLVLRDKKETEIIFKK